MRFNKLKNKVFVLSSVNSLNSYLEINLPFRKSASSISWILALKVATILIFKISEYKPSVILRMFAIPSLKAFIWRFWRSCSQSSKIKIESFWSNINFINDGSAILFINVLLRMINFLLCAEIKWRR